MSLTGGLIAGIGAAGSLGGAAVASAGANSAADTQSQAATQAAQLSAQSAANQLGFQQSVYNTGQNQEAPYLGAGYGALANLSNLLGINGQQGVQQPTGTAQQASGGGMGQQVPGAIGAIANAVPQTSSPGAVGGVTPGSAVGSLQGLNSLVNPSLGAAGSLGQRWNQTFTQPTLEQAQQNPGYQFQLQQGQQALQRAQTANGSSLTAGANKSLENYTQGLAQTDYQNVYNNALQNYQTNYNSFMGSQAQQFNQLASLAGVGQTAANQLNVAGQNAAANQANTLNTTTAQQNNANQSAAAARGTGYLSSGNLYGSALSGVGSQLSQLYQLSQQNQDPIFGNSGDVAQYSAGG